jgi:hypothetical protein
VAGDPRPAFLVGQQPSAPQPERDLAQVRDRYPPRPVGPRPAAASPASKPLSVDGAAQAPGRPHRTPPTPAVKAQPDRRAPRAMAGWPGTGRTPQDGRADTRRPDRSVLDDGAQVTGRPPVGHRTAGHRTAGHRTGRGAGRLDTGRLDTGPDEEPDRVDTNGGQGAAADGTAASSAYLTTRRPTTGTPPRSSAGQAPRGAVSSRDGSAGDDPAAGWPPPRPDRRRRHSAVPAGASAHCCRVLGWDGTRRGQWHYGR